MTRSTIVAARTGVCRGNRLGVLLGTTLAVLLASPALFAGQPAFSDQTSGAGVSYTHSPPSPFCMPDGSTPPPCDPFATPMQGGATVGDFNADGLPDIFVPGGGWALDKLFINQGDGTFDDEAGAWGLTDYYRGTAAIAGDCDGDGYDDIYVTSMGDVSGPGSFSPAPAAGQHRLYRNTGTGSFNEAGAAAGVNWTSPNPDSYGASMGDFDSDGDLDLWVSGWHWGGAENGNRLFENDGTCSFTNVTDTAVNFAGGLQGFGAIFSDMNGDRWPELLIAGDFGTSEYHINNRDGTFTKYDIWNAQLLGKAYNGMGTTIGDFNQDGKQDWFITAIYPTFEFEDAGNATEHWGNGLYINQGGHQYTEVSMSAGVQDGGWGWGTASLDFDHDGELDLVMTNGFPMNDMVTGETFTNEPSYLFHHDGNLNFTEIGQSIGFDHTGQGRTLMHLDYDQDGDMDIVITSNREPLQLFRNDLIQEGVAQDPDTNWLKVYLDTSGNPRLAPGGHGANVRIRIGNDFQHARINGGSNYLGRSELVAHFGLGTATNVDEVLVHWQDGFQTILTNVPANAPLMVSAGLPMSQEPMVRGQQSDITVTGLEPGEVAHFFFSVAGTGEGPCYPYFSGVCTDILAPRYIGPAAADATGTATKTVTAPGSPGVTTLYTQALVRRGQGGVASLETNVISAPLLDP